MPTGDLSAFVIALQSFSRKRTAAILFTVFSKNTASILQAIRCYTEQLRILCRLMNTPVAETAAAEYKQRNIILQAPVQLSGLNIMLHLLLCVLLIKSPWIHAQQSPAVMFQYKIKFHLCSGFMFQRKGFLSPLSIGVEYAIDILSHRVFNIAPAGCI